MKLIDDRAKSRNFVQYMRQHTVAFFLCEPSLPYIFSTSSYNPPCQFSIKYEVLLGSL